MELTFQMIIKLFEESFNKIRLTNYFYTYPQPRRGIFHSFGHLTRKKKQYLHYMKYLPYIYYLNHLNKAHIHLFISLTRDIATSSAAEYSNSSIVSY